MTPQRILITGSEGLIGRAVRAALISLGHRVVGFDLRGQSSERGDTRDHDRLREAARGVDGIIHLAAVSRVITGERDPELCRDTNVRGTGHVLQVAIESGAWTLLASSREVYGEADRLPANEDTPLRPTNIYGRTKVEGERLAASARADGATVGVARFSNAYGDINDYQDRVVPAFARAAAFGGSIRIEGTENLFDFTHVSDVAVGIVAYVSRLSAGAAPPVVHFVSGRGTTLGQLGALCVACAFSPVEVVHHPARDFDVARFVGDPTLASRALGWTTQVDIAAGFAKLVAAYRAQPSIRQGRAA